MASIVSTVVLACTCTHVAQDEIYGRGRRLHNVAPDNLGYCTVCAPNKTHHRNTTYMSPLPAMGFAGAMGRSPRIGKPVPGLTRK